MALKYRFNLKDIRLQDFKVYLLALFKGVLPKKKIRNLKDLENYIQKKSAWVSQVTLYGYLKTRMGTKYVLHFDDEKLLGSINTAKWNIYSVALQDMTLYSISYLNLTKNYQEINQALYIYNSILDKEKLNDMPPDLIVKAKKEFQLRFDNLDWKKYCTDLPFNKSALALYEWAPIADELKTLDRKIVLNSMILKWDNVREEFKKLINF
ncbi:MAG: esterase [Flavobacteriales bacterium]|nr:esterase [Flavobacteriales bacterium]|tara:strand:+ start:141 stop:767 length:627 start_codon:yes stop_codon:yes gene_type:complete